MGYIYVDNLNFEFAESPNFADILQNSGSGTPSIGEQVISPSYIYVDILNLELPVAELVHTEVITCVQTSIHSLVESEVGSEVCVGHGTQTCEEVITGTPVPEPVVEVVTGGGGSQRIRVMGGRPWSEEDLYNSASNIVELVEHIGVAEELIHIATSSSGIDAKIRRPVYAKNIYDVRQYAPVEDIPVVVTPQTTRFASRSIKDEEELLLLGII